MSEVKDVRDLLDRAWMVARWLPATIEGRARFRASIDVRMALVRYVDELGCPLSWVGEERLLGLPFVVDGTLPAWTIRMEVDA